MRPRRASEVVASLFHPFDIEQGTFAEPSLGMELEVDMFPFHPSFFPLRGTGVSLKKLPQCRLMGSLS